ncbi:hypothetical protein J1N35_004168 [Gossypium stocksii]|uniref:DUF7745 domain-containing protein n=1 Tax=Gossypium stocksii TaxID=47602 RepID=A0A9D4AHR9_9ROSI|nr:hypothetical protein J1N35_004168 [Gossypium stocksii]
MAIHQSLQDEDIEWRAPWMILDEILYKCGDFDWVPLLGIWRAVGYAPKSSKLRKRIEKLEEEKVQLGLDIDVQKLEVEEMKKGKNKVKEELDSLKTNYKKLHLSMRTARLGKASEQWRQEIQEEKIRAN